MTTDGWLTNLTRRVEALEAWRTARTAVEGERESNRKARQWAVNLAFTAINTLVFLLNFWLSRK